ncbi:MAG: sigma-70 family RNA polymerase sigma factor [Peptococcaceae bacterium]|nr:sigma-70 family RNA polymerase sigma factor [Peptococcaceae bacterium]
MKELIREYKNPIIINFFQKKETRLLLEKVLESPSKENREKIDDAFREYYVEIRLKRFLSDLIHYTSINFDKDRRRQMERYLLILDAPVNDLENESTFAEILPSEQKLEQILLEKETRLEEIFTDQNLSKVIHYLTAKEKRILEYIFIMNMSDTSISKTLGVSQQAVSKTKKRALSKLRQKIKTGGDNNGSTRRSYVGKHYG